MQQVFFAPAHTFAIKAPFRSDDFLFAMLNFLTRKNAEMRDVYKNIEKRELSLLVLNDWQKYGG
jgi:hypothetical protein